MAAFGSSYDRFKSLLYLICHSLFTFERIDFLLSGMIYRPCSGAETQGLPNLIFTFCELCFAVHIFENWQYEVKRLVNIIRLLVSSISLLSFVRIVPKYTKLLTSSKLEPVKVAFSPIGVFLLVSAMIFAFSSFIFRQLLSLPFQASTKPPSHTLSMAPGYLTYFIPKGHY